jgi:hypothetical protein
MKCGAISLTFLILFLAPAWPLASQETPKEQSAPPKTEDTTGEPDSSATDNEMEDWLNENGKELDHLVRLGVDTKVADAFTSEDNNGLLFPEWAFARMGMKSRVGVLFLPCNWTDFAYAYLVQFSAGGWHVTDQDQFDCHYDDDVSMAIVQIREADRDEIAIHHACNGRGSGYLEQDFSVYFPTRGKLKVELETEEVLHSSRIGYDRPHDLDRKSTFTIIPISGSQARAIEQTRRSVFNGNLTVQRRIFRWHPTKGRYLPSAFTPVVAAAN